MYFIVIMAFAFVLSDEIPPASWTILRHQSPSMVLGIIVGQMVMIATASWIGRRRTLSCLNGTAEGHEAAIDRLTAVHHVILWLISASLVGVMMLTPWTRVVRGIVLFRNIPLAAELLILLPFFVSTALAWAILFRAELRVRREALGYESPMGDTGNVPATPAPPPREASLIAYLGDKFRHHVLIVAAPMLLVVLAKFFTDRYRPHLTRLTHLPWISDSILGVTSAVVLLFSPVILRYVWATERLREGPLRDRFVRTCERIGLKYQEILLWRTHGMAVNAAVMGFIPRLRYILVSDALLQMLRDEEIEAVFAHEAGHVQHWHLHFFGLFALVSMFVAGGVLELLWVTGLVADIAILNLIAMAVLMLCWLFGFGWLSRRFERQADLYGVRCVTPDIETCLPSCPVHGGAAQSRQALCISASNLFGRTLLKIADLNGIPRHAPSWRHGSIDSRCRLIEQLATNPAALRRFDRLLLWLKIGLLLFTVAGTVVSALIYYPDIAKALGLPR